MFCFSRVQRTLRPFKGCSCCNDKKEPSFVDFGLAGKRCFRFQFWLFSNSLGLGAFIGPWYSQLQKCSFLYMRQIFLSFWLEFLNCVSFGYDCDNQPCVSKPWSNGPASGRKLNLRRDLRWVAKPTGKFPHKYRRVAKRLLSRQTYPVFHWLIIRKWTSLNLR